MQKGSAIFFTIITIAVISGIAFGLSTLIVGSFGILRGQGNSAVALYAADAGIEQLLYDSMACSDENCVSTAATNIGTVVFITGPPSATYSITSVVPGGSGTCPVSAVFCAQSTGVFNGVSRRVEIER